MAVSNDSDYHTVSCHDCSYVISPEKLSIKKDLIPKYGKMEYKRACI